MLSAEAGRNILKDSLENILASDEYAQQAQAMIRRECPGCTCGVESSLAMKHAFRPLFFHLGRLTQGQTGNEKRFPIGVAEVNDTPNA